MANARTTFSAKIHGPTEQRLCLDCTGALVPDARWGSWNWGWGDCSTCKHFGLTTEAEHVRVAHEQVGLDKQQTLGL